MFQLSAWRELLSPNHRTLLALSTTALRSYGRVAHTVVSTTNSSLLLELYKQCLRHLRSVVCSCICFCVLLLTVLERHTPSKGRFIEGNMASNYGSPHRSGRNARFHKSDQFTVLPSVVEDSSHGSASTDSFSSSGGSLSQLGPDDPADHAISAPRGQVNNQALQAKQLVSLA